MRITGGTARGCRLIGPKRRDHTIRPTSDRVREAIFNILGDAIAGAFVLDLFAGTGSFGLEALSRGAGSVIFVDNAPGALEIIGQNLRSCFKNPPARVFKLDLNRAASLSGLRQQLPKEYRSTLIFLDPPYEKKLAEKLLKMVQSSGLPADNALIIAEERQNQTLPTGLERLQLSDQRRYGETGLWFYTFSS